MIKKQPSRYSVQYSCSNCGWNGSQTFDRGAPAPAMLECPKCGCRTASRGWKMPPPIMIPQPRPVIPWNPWKPLIEPWEPWRLYPMDPRDPPWQWDRPIYNTPPPIPTRTTDNTRDDAWSENKKQDFLRNRDYYRVCQLADGHHEFWCKRY